MYDNHVCYSVNIIMCWILLANIESRLSNPLSEHFGPLSGIEQLGYIFMLFGSIGLIFCGIVLLF